MNDPRTPVRRSPAGRPLQDFDMPVLIDFPL
jgi:hypothetical protein